MKEKIIRWYPKLWTKDMVRDAVEKKAITPAEYKEITGEEYAE